MGVIKTKVKQVKYERLVSDPHGYNNTKIGIIAEVDENENPVNVINDLRLIVNNRHETYLTVNQLKSEMSRIASSLDHINYKIQQIEITFEHKDKITVLRKKKYSLEEQIMEIKKKIDTTLG